MCDGDFNGDPGGRWFVEGAPCDVVFMEGAVGSGERTVSVRRRLEYCDEVDESLRAGGSAVSVRTMRRLVPGDPRPVLPDDAYDWPAPRWVRACMVMGLDGSIAGPDGRSGSISSATDRAVLAAIRRYADAYLVGAQTVRAERYSAVRAQPEAVERRTAAGQAAAPTLAVVSATCRFDWDDVAFTGSENRPLILTVARSLPTDRQIASRWCDVVVVGEERVDPGAALAALAERGLTRVTCEGGASLLADMIRSDVLDEIDLTLAPLATGAQRPVAPGHAVLGRMDLHQLLEDDGFLFARYLRRR